MNALRAVAAIQRATAIVAEWDATTYDNVVAHLPLVAREHNAKARDWAVTVELLRRDYEMPATAAERLALYMTMHAERWDSTPTLHNMREDYLR